MATKSTTRCITVVMHLPESPALRTQIMTDFASAPPERCSEDVGGW